MFCESCGENLVVPTFFDTFGMSEFGFFLVEYGYCVSVFSLVPIIAHKIARLATVKRSSLQNLYNLAVLSRIIMKFS